MKPAAVIAIASTLAATGLAAGYWYGMNQGMRHAAPPAGESARDPGRNVLYWYDPMYPQHRFDQPGKSPFMDMQLVPKYAEDSGGGGAGISISPRVVQNLGIRTAEARRGSLEATFATVGNVEWNERTIVVVQPRAAGFVERLHVRAPLDPVRAGAPLVEILFPEWAGAQAEYLALRRISGADAESLARAARQRLVLLGMTETEIVAAERAGEPHGRVTLRSPISGVVAELGVREGMTVAAGATLFRIAGLGTVWIVAEVPEAQAALLVTGARVEARVPSFPDDVFEGRVGAILPEVNPTTRTVRARVEIANPTGRLKPGMFATLVLGGQSRESVLVPSEAVIRTGQRSVVILALDGGKFRAADVDVGMESGGETEIRTGLQAGDRVVVSGQFLIDSEASLRSTLARLEDAGGDASTPVHRAEGVLVSGDAQSLLIEHGPVPSAGMGAMTMEFGAPATGLPPGLKPGDRIRFEFTMRDGEFRTTRVEAVK